jgi:hypothetical protein
MGGLLYLFYTLKVNIMKYRNVLLPLGGVLGIGLIAFVINFYLAFQQGIASALRTTQPIQAHLNYIMTQNDDMALVDWAKLLENPAENITARVDLNQKTVATSGNQEKIPVNSPLGLSFEFPNYWLYHQMVSLPGQQNSTLEVKALFLSIPDPMSWGWIGLLDCSAIGVFLLIFQFRMTHLHKISSTSIKNSYLAPQKNYPTDEVDASISFNGNRTPQVIIDGGYIVKQVSEEAAQILGKDQNKLVGAHLFDLAPHPELTEALKKGEPLKVSQSFMSPAKLSARILPEKEGWLILIEPPEKH